ncbi:MAG: hypothetical protein M1335_04595 [Chloroflexi bacterium]|nr:hypothetical protein [Chloroflexota bacterium]
MSTQGPTNIIVVPVWLLLITMPAFGYLAGLLLRRLAARGPNRIARASSAIITGGGAAAISDQIPRLVCGTAFLGVELLIFAVTLAAVVGACTAYYAEFTAPGASARLKLVMAIIGAAIAGYVGGLVVWEWPFSGSHWAESMGIYAGVWWGERYLLFAVLLVLSRRMPATGKPSDHAT